MHRPLRWSVTVLSLATAKALTIALVCNVLISIPALRMNAGTTCMYVSNSYSTVGVIKQRNMVNSGVRGTKGMDLD